MELLWRLNEYICMYVCMCVCVYIYTHTTLHSPSSKVNKCHSLFLSTDDFTSYFENGDHHWGSPKLPCSFQNVAPSSNLPSSFIPTFSALKQQLLSWLLIPCWFFILYFRSRHAFKYQNCIQHYRVFLPQTLIGSRVITLFIYFILYCVWDGLFPN